MSDPNRPNNQKGDTGLDRSNNIFGIGAGPLILLLVVVFSFVIVLIYVLRIGTTPIPPTYVTLAATITQPPTLTALPPTTTLNLPTATNEPATATSVPPTETPLSPTNTAIPPTDTPTPTSTSADVRLGSDGMPLLRVPAGDFWMGVNGGGNNPRHTVYLAEFWLDQYEISNAQYAACVTARECRPPAVANTAQQLRYYDNPAFVNFPVVHVTWHQAQEYCEWVNRDLPTEAQWEKAARGITERRYPWGEDRPTRQITNVGQPTNGDPMVVDAHPFDVSPYGAVDMGGNVQEWVFDWYNEGYYNLTVANTDPYGPTSGSLRVTRGSSWFSELNATSAARTAVRYYAAPDKHYDYLGFRCATAQP